MLLDRLKKYNVTLASNSPRRKQLLADLGINFQVRVKNDIDESYPPDLPALEIAEYISRKKAQAYRQHLLPSDIVITADTVVVLNDHVLGKPTSAAHACDMLRELSGKVHKVVTGVTITMKDRQRSFSVTTDVEFATLNDDDISHYVNRYNPIDKAGAYGIQEWIGCMGVRHINGSFYNVMGLPLHRLYNELDKMI